LPRIAIYLGIIGLVILHYDFWLWDDPTLVFGFLPVGLAYHVAYTLATAALWYFAVKYAWPRNIVRFAETDDDAEGGGA